MVSARFAMLSEPTPVPDTHTVPVTIDVEPAAAALLDNDLRRALVGQVVSRMLQAPSAERLLQVMEEISTEARKRGLTDELLEAELAAYNAEGREAPPA